MLPKFSRGLVVTYPHGQYIASGRKKLLIKSKPYQMTGEPLLVIERKMAVAVVVPGKMREIDLAEFRKLRPRHLVSDAERLRWWGRRTKLYAFPVEKVRRLKKPIPVSYPNGAQVFVTRKNIRVA